ncbi:MAG TPA: fumarylacetoacetate hydrolase family protein [Solirubrobacteraceae bacterium]|jgi:acylpyruvate hydrolase|nr:fumarylacetoacetate hydrolase family protein [Solirubrobacteraceae bacterium]
MRLVSYQTEEGPAAAVLLGEDLVPVATLGAPATTVRGLLAACDAAALRELQMRAEQEDERIALAGVTLHAPVTDPQKIVCLGLNYRDHAEETGQDIPANPMWFAKFANSLVGSGQDIVLPGAHAEYVDYEAELALVIGRPARNVDAKDALAHIAGAMPFNDVSARDLQLQNPLWTSGKAIDSFAPCGPALVTLDEIEDLRDLGLRTRVNGEQLQQGSTANLIFGPAEVLAWLSRTMTLLPGDIIATGTPAGVGAAQGRFLKDGDTVEVEIDGLGTLVNLVRSE